MSKTRIAILTPNENAYSETFIHKHIEFLPFEKIVIFGSDIPFKMRGEDDHFLPLSFLEKVKRKIRPVANDYRELRLKYFLSKYKIQAVLAEFVYTGANIVKICEELNIPIVTTGLGYELSHTKTIEQYREAYKGLAKTDTTVIVVAKYMMSVLFELGFKNEKVIYSPAGASPDFFNVVPNYNSKQIVAIGRFVSKKAPHLTIFAFHKVLSVVPDAKLIMAGDGLYFDLCIDIVKCLGIEQKVIFVGSITQQQQKMYFESSRVFVQHSRISKDGDSEGTPVVIIEASSAGLPVISTFHAGIPDVIVHEQTGFLVKEGDMDKMADYMIRLLQDSEQSKKMGERGREYIRKNFTLEQHINIVATAIENAVNKRK
ncbi:MAG: glycosyltransferase family 4 protein [Bacteroidota bacterium]